MNIFKSIVVGAAVLVAASEGAWAACRQFDEVVVNKVDGVVESFDVSFTETEKAETNTLFLAYGVTDGGDTTNGWEHVKIVSYVMPDERSKHVSAPTGCGSEVFYAQFFLGEGMTAPYDTRYESYTKNGNSYIDTGFVPDQDTRVVADLTVNGQEYWFGCWSVNFSTGAFAVRWETATQIYRGYNGCYNITSGLSIEKGKRYVLDFNKNTLSLTGLDGSIGFATNTCQGATFSSRPYTLYLYAFNQRGTYTSSGGGTTIHRCQIYDNGQLVRDLIPVSKDGTAYMFDLANVVFYPFLDGTPTAGAVVTRDAYAECGEISDASKRLAFEDVREFVVVRWDPAATGTGDGKSWANACTDLSEAVLRAGVYKGEVWIKGGTYSVDKPLTVKSNVAVLGGFDGRDGVYADDEAERAARDPVANETVFTSSNKTLVNLDAYALVDATAVVDGIRFRNTSGGWLVYSSDAVAAYGYPSFSNCTFSGGAIVLQRCAATFSGCRFESLEGGTYGRIFLENTLQKVVFEDCAFVSVTNNTKFGLINLADGARSSFKRCRFEDCVGQSSGEATIHNDHASPDTLEKCVFVRCQTTDGGIVSGVSMSDCRFESCRATSHATSLLTAAGCIMRTTFVGNVVQAERPTVTSGLNYVDLLKVNSQMTTFVNCTFDRNVCEAVYGEGATVVRSTVRWGLWNAMGGAVNCTFRDNGVDHDLTACGIVNNNHDYTSGYDVQLVNVVTSNDNADYRAVRTFDCQTGGFCVYSSYLQGFVENQEYAFIQLSDDIRADDPRCEAKCVDDGLHRAVRLSADSSAKRHRGRTVEVGANGVVRFKNKFGSDIYRFNSMTAPTEPIVTIGDILGNERPEGRFLPGSAQVLAPSGLMLFIR